MLRGLLRRFAPRNDGSAIRKHLNPAVRAVLDDTSAQPLSTGGTLPVAIPEKSAEGCREQPCST